MKSIKRVAALVMALLFVGCGVLSNVGTISQVEAAAKISVKKKTLNQGQKLTLKVTGVKGTIKWSVSNDNVKLNKKSGKTVKVTAVKAGTSKVTAKAKGKKLTCTIKVNGLNIVNKTLNVGQKFNIQLKGLGKKVKWSQKGGVVTVKGNKAKATVTANKAGKGTVIAKVGKKSYKCTVVVSKPAPAPTPKPEPTPTPTPTPDPEPEPEPVEGETPDNPIQLMQEPPILVEIPAGKVVYYAGYYDGQILSIEDATAYVVIGDMKYVPVDGVVSVELHSAGFRMPVVFGVGNDGTEDKTYTVNIDWPKGSRVNPAEVVEGAGSVTFEAGNDAGYWFGYTAEQPGVLHVTVSGEEGWQYSVENPDQMFYGDYHYSDDEPVVSTEQVPVAQGETVAIWVATYDVQATADPFNFYPNPAGSVSVAVEFEAAAGQIYGPTSTVEVAAGDLNCYEGWGIGGMIMTINDMDAYVFVGGTKYVAWDGPLTIELPSMNPRMPVAVFVGNKGTENKTFEISFSYPEGHMENPKVAEDGEYVAEIKAGSQGYFYTYTATAAGTLQISVSGENGWSYTINNLTSYAYGEFKNSVDNADESVVTIEVSAGDEIQIIVNTFNPDDPYSAPEGAVNVAISYNKAPTNMDVEEDTDDGYGEIF